jgi:hypothetical protein
VSRSVTARLSDLDQSIYARCPALVPLACPKATVIPFLSFV